MSLSKAPLDQEDQDAIILDARHGEIGSLREIFTTLIDPSLLPTCRDEDTGTTALHMAAGNGHIMVVQYLLSLLPDEDDRKEYVNAVNNTGNTALHWASLNGKLDVVKLLCDEYDADPFIRNQFGHDAIFEAENNGREEVETYFLKKYDVEPENEEEDNGKTETADVEVTEGHEIEEVTKEATEALKEETEKLNLNSSN
ncbi:hypothetical protein NCAS_0G01190 [Naumovozyma castellii]|uniref:Uncharacterized protein n=1 Tax=Naumovozyma castellii TaxID=27288 RepID=G0VHX2_NAUCA|nr:hypothetical protein NCAS_0G01190 [Naumovozyma castellii CBS 4309]CCC71006.1 hypothetical protein NCAS_0G01190 [Naumovozyma castellii CBS 4309]